MLYTVKTVNYDCVFYIKEENNSKIFIVKEIKYQEQNKKKNNSDG